MSTLPSSSPTKVLSLDELKAQIRKTLQRIQDTQDDGYYAKLYTKDMTALLQALEAPAPQPLPKAPTPCPECGSLKDNIYCATCTPVDQ